MSSSPTTSSSTSTSTAIAAHHFNGIHSVSANNSNSNSPTKHKLNNLINLNSFNNKDVTPSSSASTFADPGEEQVQNCKRIKLSESIESLNKITSMDYEENNQNHNGTSSMKNNRLDQHVRHIYTEYPDNLMNYLKRLEKSCMSLFKTDIYN